MRLFEFFREPENPLMGTPRDTVYSRGKAHTSKRVSVIVSDNAISKVQSAPRTRLRENLQRTPKRNGDPAGYCVPVGESQKQKNRANF